MRNSNHYLGGVYLPNQKRSELFNSSNTQQPISLCSRRRKVNFLMFSGKNDRHLHLENHRMYGENLRIFWPSDKHDSPSPVEVKLGGVQHDHGVPKDPSSTAMQISESINTLRRGYPDARFSMTLWQSFLTTERDHFMAARQMNFDKSPPKYRKSKQNGLDSISSWQEIAQERQNGAEEDLMVASYAPVMSTGSLTLWLLKAKGVWWFLGVEYGVDPSMEGTSNLQVGSSDKGFDKCFTDSVKYAILEYSFWVLRKDGDEYLKSCQQSARIIRNWWTEPKVLRTWRLLALLYSSSRIGGLQRLPVCLSKSYCSRSTLYVKRRTRPHRSLIPGSSYFTPVRESRTALQAVALA